MTATEPAAATPGAGDGAGDHGSGPTLSRWGPVRLPGRSRRDGGEGQVRIRPGRPSTVGWPIRRIASGPVRCRNDHRHRAPRDPKTSFPVSVFGRSVKPARNAAACRLAWRAMVQARPNPAEPRRFPPDHVAGPRVSRVPLQRQAGLPGVEIADHRIHQAEPCGALGPGPGVEQVPIVGHRSGRPQTGDGGSRCPRGRSRHNV